MPTIPVSFRNDTDTGWFLTIIDTGKNPEEQIFHDHLDPQQTVDLHLESDDGEWGKARWEHKDHEWDNESHQGYADVRGGSIEDIVW